MGLMQAWTTGKSVTSSDGFGDANIQNQSVLGKGKTLFTPSNPGDFSGIELAPDVPSARAFTRQEAQALKLVEKQSQSQAESTEKAYGSLKKISGNQRRINISHNQYRTKRATDKFQEVKSNAIAAKKLHSLRPSYAGLAVNLTETDQQMTNQVQSIEQGLLNTF